MWGSIISEWASLLLRWLHVVAAIAWIGSSFYFIALDNHLRPPRDAEEGVGGESWEIHGGGFYRIHKYRVAPEELPEPLHWFKWEAYTTWLSGFALLVILYYFQADTFLIDKSVADLSVWEAILISVGLLAGVRRAVDRLGGLRLLGHDGLCCTLLARTGEDGHQAPALGGGERTRLLDEDRVADLRLVGLVVGRELGRGLHDALVQAVTRQALDRDDDRLVRLVADDAADLGLPLSLHGGGGSCGGHPDAPTPPRASRLTARAGR
jgi:hypothetical protein